ncbi:MAG TPA: PspC domain-containing protein [Fibrobacteria bacterium]|nr:PspC domain-containing protein [Fibrobacteria bacterium]
MSLKKFQRSSRDRKVAGLFGGLGDAFDIDPTYLRLGFILLAMITGVFPLLLGYVIGWIITQDDSVGAGPDAGTRYHPPESADPR